MSFIFSGCAQRASHEPQAIGAKRSAIVYGMDDRREFYETQDKELRAWIDRSMVVLMPRTAVTQGETFGIMTPNWGEGMNLCSDEPFIGQPIGAYCSGILVDWDLVLTAGHCVRALAPPDLLVVFGYYYSAEGQLAVASTDVMEPLEIVAEALDDAGDQPRLDYAWLRLTHDVPAPHGPASIRRRPAAESERLLSIGAGGGLPIKSDGGSRVVDARAASFDYFVADADTMRGSSGGAALDDQLSVLGILSRGGPDLMETGAGCYATVRQPDGEDAEEEFTYASRALDGLCAVDEDASSLCRSDCGDPCLALPQATGSQCTMSTNGAAFHPSSTILFASTLLLLKRRKGRRDAT